MVVTDTDLVTKLMSLPWEARAELYNLLGGQEAEAQGSAAKSRGDDDEDPRRHITHGHL